METQELREMVDDLAVGCVCVLLVAAVIVGTMAGIILMR